MLSEVLFIGAALVAGFIVGIPFGMAWKNRLLTKAAEAQAKFDAAVAKAVEAIKK